MNNRNESLSSAASPARIGRITLEVAVGMGVAGTLIAAIAVAVLIAALGGDSKPPEQAQKPMPKNFVPPERPPEVVPVNPAEKVFGAFEGPVHPLLTGQTSLAVTAHCSPVSQGGRDELYKKVPPETYRLFSELNAAIPEKVYTERNFSRLLMPKHVKKVGQVWKLDDEQVLEFLRQFHPQASLHVVSGGRRAGPDGAFGILRAVSANHVDVVLRIHAEFNLAPNVWLTPACFWGRMIIDKEAGTVEYFRLWTPTERSLNMHLTVREHRSEYIDEEKGLVHVANKRDIVHVDRMELVSPGGEIADKLTWDESIEVAAAQSRLKQVFYASEYIHWVPWDKAVEIAGEQRKPIFALVLWGAIDDQSC